MSIAPYYLIQIMMMHLIEKTALLLGDDVKKYIFINVKNCENGIQKETVP